MPKMLFRFMGRDEGLKNMLASRQKGIRKLNNSFSNINKDVNRSSSTFTKFGKSLAFGKVAVMGYAVMRLGQSIMRLTQASMDQIETQNLFNVALADTAVATGVLIDKMSNIYGLDSTNIRNAVGTFSLLARSMGMSTAQAQTLSTSVYQLAVDLSSLTNIPIEQVMHDMRSGLVGQSETVYKYGMDVTEAALKSEALAQGISKSVRQMSQGEKMALRYAVMIKTGEIAMGDFAKTIETPANQSRILSQRITTLSRSLGSMFIPALTAILPYLNAFAIVLIRAANAVAKLFGYVADVDENTPDTFGDMSGDLDDVESGLGAVTSGVGDVDKAVKKLRITLLGFDELNIMADNSESSNAGIIGSGSGLAGLSVGSILGDMNLGAYNSLLDAIPSKAKEIADKIAGIFKRMKGHFDFTNIKTAWGNLKSALSSLADLSWQHLVWVWDNILVPLGTWLINDAVPVYLDFLAAGIDVLTSALEFLEPLGIWLWDNFLKPLAIWSGDLIIKGLEGLTTGLSALSALLDDIGTWELWKDLKIWITKKWKWVTSGETWQEFWKDISSSAWKTYKDIEVWISKLWKWVRGGKTWQEFGKEGYGDDWVTYKSITVWISKKWKWVSGGKTWLEFWDDAFSREWITSKSLTIFISKIWKWASGGKTWQEFWADTFEYEWTRPARIKVKVKKLFSWENVTDDSKRMEGWLNTGFNNVTKEWDRFWGKQKPLEAKIKGKMVVDWAPSTYQVPTTLGGSKYTFKPIMFAEGGIVNSPTLSVLGEAGSEAVLPLNPTSLSKYLAPVLGNNTLDEEKQYSTMYRAMKDALNEQEETMNVYVDGVYQKTIREMKRRNVRSGRIIVPVGG